MPTVTEKLIESHLVEGALERGSAIAIDIDQTLTQDATGTAVMLELEALGLDRVRTEVSAQYVDHNLIQEDNRNPDDHLFLQSACRRWGIWYSRPGNGVSHPVHMERFGRPGRTMLGSDSHTPAAGSLGMLAMGAGGLDVAMAMAGEPFWMRMPRIWGVRLTGSLPEWVSAKDVILEMLRRHGVDGGLGKVIEYHGPGLDSLSAMDRHVIANMGAELGATTTVFPADEAVRSFLSSQGREDTYIPLTADPEAAYDLEDEIDLSSLEPLIALPSSPGNVVPVAEVAGEPIYQSYIGSSANPGYRDFAVAAEMVSGRRVADSVSLDVNPTSRQILENLIADGHVLSLVQAGARLHQAGCNGCIGMGQAPASGRNSLRTVPRNFPSRSGTPEDSVFLCSPETAAASALTGVITDPRDLPMEYPPVTDPACPIQAVDMLEPPLPPGQAQRVELDKGPNIVSLPDFDPLPDRLELPVLLTLGDDISTDEILPAGVRVLPFRSNIPEIARFCFEVVDDSYPRRAGEVRGDGHVVVAGRNYGQGSSREHAVIAPRFLGLRVVLATSIARIHRQNLPNFGVLPLTWAEPESVPVISEGDVVEIEGLHQALSAGNAPVVRHRGVEVAVQQDLTEREAEILLEGGFLNWMKERL
ncbi:MAG: aconitate hydratase [Actinomycetota bacterium]